MSGTRTTISHRGNHVASGRPRSVPQFLDGNPQGSGGILTLTAKAVCQYHSKFMLLCRLLSDYSQGLFHISVISCP